MNREMTTEERIARAKQKIRNSSICQIWERIIEQDMRLKKHARICAERARKL